MMNHEINAAFRARLQEDRALLLPGAANALAARVIEDCGFEAIFLTGAGLTNSYYGKPDLGFMGLSDIAAHTAAIRNISALPIIADADTGFGNAVNMYHSVRTLELAGASAIQIEDQINPKRCGHFSGKDVVALPEARDRIRAAVDARTDPNLMILARTDARATQGLEAALDRAAAFIEDGADITFVEAPENAEEIRAIPARLKNTPQLLNIVVGGRTPTLEFDELEAMGFSLILYANVALQAAIRGMYSALHDLKSNRKFEDTGAIAGFEERQRVVNKSYYDGLEKRYGE
ncbi:isocitrate lyase/PEP mutase family protein [Antarctobacter heliothermus]|uniref:Phosphoenolpyruvate phosphomutase n=1 Tax=Antarctobacter heliothermus TaxID=74033 RepID=A0A239BDM4_9RHOB|nr:isocitrate lyase/PEP mutase family protein [Antarctobacter heliothermus]SNS06105.1 Phosphoenolpyruvate phosphomutase [Antarctobacter heliothermus]